MISYEKFAPFYDEVMGDRKASAAEVRSMLQKHHPKCESVLELACGTGAVLQYLAEDYEVAGLDLSPSMLRVARRRLPRVKLHRGDMTEFELKRGFDAIICVFDSINHLLQFSKWQRVFTRCHSHLNNDGIFLFDVNTPSKLKSFGAAPVWVHQFGSDYLIMDVDCDKRALSTWDIKVFEKQKGGQFRLHAEVIREKAFPRAQIKDALLKRYRSVKVVDLKRGRVSDSSEKLHFVARK